MRTTITLICLLLTTFCVAQDSEIVPEWFQLVDSMGTDILTKEGNYVLGRSKKVDTKMKLEIDEWLKDKNEAAGEKRGIEIDLNRKWNVVKMPNSEWEKVKRHR